MKNRRQESSMTKLPKVDYFSAQPGAKAYRLRAEPQEQFSSDDARKRREKGRF
jgi:hypothetical protein